MQQARHRKPDHQHDHRRRGDDLAHVAQPQNYRGPPFDRPRQIVYRANQPDASSRGRDPRRDPRREVGRGRVRFMTVERLEYRRQGFVLLLERGVCRNSQVQLDLLMDRGSEFEAQSAKARVALVRWIGADAAKREPAETLPALAIRPDVQRLVAHPQIATIDKSIAVLERETALAREALKPDWSMELGYGARGAGQDDMLSVQVGFELQVAPAKRQDRQIAAKLEELDALQAQREDRLRTLKAGLQSALAEKQSLEIRIARYLNDILPVSKQRTEATLVSYRNGKAEFSSVLEARRAELDMGLQLLALQAALARSEVDLAYFAPEGAQP